MRLEIALSNPERPDLRECGELEIRPEVLLGRISDERLTRIGVHAFRTMPFRRLDGSAGERKIAAVRFNLVGRTGLGMVLVGQPGEEEFVGFLMLASVGLKFDEAENKLVEPIWPALVAD